MKRSNKIIQNQRLFYFILVILFFAVVGAVAFLLIEEEKVPELIESREKQVDLPLDSLNPQEILNNRVEKKLEIFKKRFEEMEISLLQSKIKEEDYEKENSLLKRELQDIKLSLEEKERLKSLENKIEKSNSETSHTNQSIFSYSSNLIPFQQEEEPRRGLVVKVVNPEKNMVQHVDKVIPPGTTVRAVLVSSVDAPMGAYSSSNPQPVKLQILDDGHLPKSVRARLKGGIIVGSAYGDLSSERLYIRIERMAQVKSTGDFIETAVTGFVSGEDGKYGVRGTVVDKSSKLVRNAALSGVMSGVNSYFQAYASNRWNCFGYGNCCPVDGECSSKDLAYGLAAQGGTSGIDSAFNTLTDYYIKRAELINPVLQVNAGRIVDITFTLSSEIGDIHSCEKAQAIRNQTRKGNQKQGFCSNEH